VSKTQTTRFSLRPPASSPGWEETLSRELSDLTLATRDLKSEWKRRFGLDAFTHPLFAQAYLEVVRNHSILGVFRAIHERDGGGATGSPAGARSFEERLEQSLLEVGGAARSPESVPVSPFFYLDRLIERTRAEKAEGHLVDLEPLLQVLRFLRPLLDLPALSGFRQDTLERFPSKLDSIPPEVCSGERKEMPPPRPRWARAGFVGLILLALGLALFALWAARR